MVFPDLFAIRTLLVRFDSVVGAPPKTALLWALVPDPVRRTRVVVWLANVVLRSVTVVDNAVNADAAASWLVSLRVSVSALPSLLQMLATRAVFV